MTITAPANYLSGETYQITVRVADPNQRRWGFELSARTQDGQQAGTLDPTDVNTQCLNGPSSGPCEASFNGIQYISHSNTGTRPGVTQGVDFTFNWTAPDVSAGPVVMHAAGNAANNNGTNSGDRIYTTSATIQPLTGPQPTIFTGGVVNIASLAPDPAPMAPGSIAVVSGTDLNDGSLIPFSSFGDDGKLVTTLGGGSAKINGISTPILYSFPGQVAVQIPFELANESNASIEVIANGQTSAPQTIFLDSAAPGIFTLNQLGTGQAAVLIANTFTLAAPLGSAMGLISRPAHRGETISIYCTGLGAVSEELETGRPATAATTPIPATVMIDGLQATVVYSGTAPGFVGLYRVDAVVPDDARFADDVSLVISMGDKQSNTVTLAVGP